MLARRADHKRWKREFGSGGRVRDFSKNPTSLLFANVCGHFRYENQEETADAYGPINICNNYVAKLFE